MATHTDPFVLCGGAMDAVVSCQVVQHVPTREARPRVWRHVAYAARSGGRLAEGRARSGVAVLPGAEPEASNRPTSPALGNRRGRATVLTMRVRVAGPSVWRRVRTRIVSDDQPNAERVLLVCRSGGWQQTVMPDGTTQT